MDPEAALRLASESLETGEIGDCAVALIDYAKWRMKGGFEPKDGDFRFASLGRKLVRAIDINC